MGLKCSLLGHSFDETDVERDREERGNEVVTVVREVERCSRCDQTRIISENKEVTSIVEPDDVGLEGTQNGMSSSQSNVDTAEVGVDANDWPDETENGVEEVYEPPDNPEEEDAEILQDNGTTERQPGQWPDDEEDWSPDRLTSEEGKSPGSDDAAVNIAEDADSEPEAGTDDKVSPEDTALPNDDAELIDADATSARRSAGEEEPDRRSGENTNSGQDDDPVDVEESQSAASHDRVPSRDRTYVCRECGFTTSTENSPLRAGDSCPECQRGYLTVEDR